MPRCEDRTVRLPDDLWEVLVRAAFLGPTVHEVRLCDGAAEGRQIYRCAYVYCGVGGSGAVDGVLPDTRTHARVVLRAGVELN